MVAGDRIVRIPYSSVRNGNRFFEPRGRMVRMGFRPQALGPDNEATRRRAMALYERWLAVRTGRASVAPTKGAKATREEACLAKRYPHGSIGEAWQTYVRGGEWARKAASTRHKIWWEAWNKRIEPIFGDVRPDIVTMQDISDWRAKIEAVSGADPAHKALKVWRAFWLVLQGLRYTQLTDPSAKVVNREPPSRTQRYGHGEVMRLVKAAWRAGYRGMACIILVTYDTGFQPVDARTLRRRHLEVDPKTSRYVMNRSLDGRAKTGVPVIGTLSKFGHHMISQYLDQGGLEHHPEAILFRMRRGGPYGESRLSNDFATIRAMVDPKDVRQLRDMRRTGVMEVFTGADEGAAVLSSEKFGNTISHSNRLFKTYNPVDLEKVKLADEARAKGRRRKNKS